MLNVLRQSFREKPYLKWVLIAVAFGLVFYLGGDFLSGGAAKVDWVARVNGTEVSERSFRETARNIDQNYRDLLGASFEQFRGQLSIGQRALNSLITREVVLQDARRMGLKSSPADLANAIRNYPSLQDAGGQFIGKEQYETALSRTYTGGVPAFERRLSDDLLVERWTRTVTQPVRVSDDELREIFSRRTEKTAIDYVVVTSASREIDHEVEDSEMRQWYDDHQGDYRRPEARVVRYVVVDREAVLSRIEVSQEAIRAHYDANPSTYSHPEQRQARHILFRADPQAAPDEDSDGELRRAAESALERLRDGEDFADLARELSQDPATAEGGGDLDFFGRGAMFDSFEEAAFGTPVGQLAPITETPHGLHVLEVTDSRPAGIAPLSDVEEEIRRLLGLQEAHEGLSSEADRLHSSIGTADRLAEVAGEQGLTVETRTVTGNQPIPGLGPAFEFVAAVSALEPGALSAPVPVAAGLAIVTVDEIVPPGPAPFEEVRASLTVDILEERSRQAALAAAADGDPAAVARRLGLEVVSSGDLTPGQAPPEAGGSAPDLNEALFGPEARKGDRGVVAVPAGALVYEISSREAFDTERFQSERSSLLDQTLESRRDSYAQALINRLLERNEIEINPAWESTLNPTG